MIFISFHVLFARFDSAGRLKPCLDRTCALLTHRYTLCTGDDVLKDRQNSVIKLPYLAALVHARQVFFEQNPN